MFEGTGKEKGVFLKVYGRSESTDQCRLFFVVLLDCLSWMQYLSET